MFDDLRFKLLVAASALALASLSTQARADDRKSDSPVAGSTEADAAKADWRKDLQPVQQPRDFGAWGFDLSAVDASVQPGDDFDRYASGAWYARTEIPADQSSAGASWDLYKVTEGQLRAIILEAPPSSQIGALFASFMDQKKVDALGLDPLLPMLGRGDALPDRQAFARMMGEATQSFSGSLVEMFTYADPNDPEVTSLFVSASGLGLPEKEYYFQERFAKEREAYISYLTRSFAASGEADPAGAAQAVFAFETQVAQRFWEVADRRNLAKINNPMTLAELQSYAPGVDWTALLSGAQVATSRKIIVTDNTALQAIAALYAETPLTTLKLWNKAHMIHRASPYLADDFVQSRFAYLSVLSGTKELRPRWTRGVQLIDTALGELLGETYVARHFPPEAKAKMQAMVADLKTAMAGRIRGNDWMSADTKAAAIEKLALMDVMVGYPDRFRDYTGLDVRSADLLGNVARISASEWAYQASKLDQPVDKSLWGMTPQTLNAYNGAFENKIVFPAGILQPPFFSLTADDAVNYGAIGAIIGHEITHGFDDQGRKIDAQGRLRDWWTTGDAERFEAKIGDFGKQYDAFEVAPGHFINGKLTMGENIADLAGLQVALDAYHASLGGKAAPAIEGLTGDQRFFLAFAQAWQNKERDASTIQQVATDEHSPARWRVLGPLPNLDSWYAAFGVRPGSAMYIPPEMRVKIW